MSQEDNKKARRPPGYKPFWESEEEETKPTPEKESTGYDWSSLKNKLTGGKTAAETATEEIEKLKKKQGY